MISRNLKCFSFLLFAFSFYCFLGTNVVSADSSDSVRKPIIVNVDQGGEQRKVKPFITGLTQADSEVMIYIDGYFNGYAKTNNGDTATDDFYYQPEVPLEIGKHIITALSKDRTSLILSSISDSVEVVIDDKLSAPTLIEFNQEKIVVSPKPLITGLVKSGCYVDVYIDGIFNGKTEVVTHKSDTANFAYKPFLNLGPGVHTVWVIAKDEMGRKSEISNIVEFKIENSLPAPIIISSSLIYGSNKPLFFSGLAKNDLIIKVFVDHKIDGEFKVVNHASGTANFAYVTKKPLTIGKHLVYTTAVDSKGKESSWSNIIYFEVLRTAAITKVAAEDSQINNTEEVGKEQEIKSEVKGVEEVKKEESVKSEDKKNNTKEDVIKNLNTNDQKIEGTGLINESKNKQMKLGWNLVIFLLFLIAVIVWIIWVNRELVKEKAKQEEEKENKLF